MPQSTVAVAQGKPKAKNNMRGKGKAPPKNEILSKVNRGGN